MNEINPLQIDSSFPDGDYNETIDGLFFLCEFVAMVWPLQQEGESESADSEEMEDIPC